jgi:dolichol-phosphate mannosyltransferase
MNNTKPLLILLATYNESENVAKMHSMLREVVPDADILFVDDNSPDGTGAIIDEIIKMDDKVFVIHRPGKMGVGGAHRDGINWAYEHEYKILISMDSDMAHSPFVIPEFLNVEQAAKVVVGTRFESKNSLAGWKWHRKLMTHLGHILTKVLLRMPYDATGALRRYDLSVIPKEVWPLVRSNGYSFFFESLHVLHMNGFKISEVSTVLPTRTYGSSKMRASDVYGGFADLIHQSYKSIFKKTCLLLPPDSANSPEDWDSYWLEKKKLIVPGLYDLIAEFYRTQIIKPTLNRVLKKEFKPEQSILHAGCGSGMVDTDVVECFNITACDFSLEALTTYSNIHGVKAKAVHADLFDTRFPKASFDGLYNLGVMEHFVDLEMKSILSEFHRILKPSGKIVLLWPPEFGLSVIFLKFAHYILNDVFGRKIQLHPPEPSRIQSKKQVMDLLTQNGFDMLNYEFGIRDLFTYVIITAQKID